MAITTGQKNSSKVFLQLNTKEENQITRLLFAGTKRTKRWPVNL